MHREPNLVRWLGIAGLVFAGCIGYRTPLEPGKGRPPGAQTDAANPARDAGADHGQDTPSDMRSSVFDDAASDARLDLQLDLRPDLVPDVRLDARLDVAPDLRRDALTDARPDVPPDVRPDVRADAAFDVRVDSAPLASCPSGEKFVLLLGRDGRMYRFDSGALATTALATVSCGGSSLNSMTVSPIGPAYISSSSGDLCVVDLRTFKASLTVFNPLTIGGRSFGMALLPDTSAAGQTLYIAVSGDAKDVNHLNRINLTTYALTVIGDIAPPVPWAELTAGPNAELYGFAVGTTESLLLNIDPKTASAIDVTRVPTGYNGAAYALVYWQDGFYLFLSDQVQGSSVYHYRKGDAQVETLGQLNASIIGAGVAACP